MDNLIKEKFKDNQYIIIKISDFLKKVIQHNQEMILKMLYLKNIQK